MLQLRQIVRLPRQRTRRTFSIRSIASTQTLLWNPNRRRNYRHFSSQQLQHDDPFFDKVLVANRGEIACRVLRTCKQLQIPTVALYSVADGPHCLHAQLADEAYQIGSGSSPTESYLLQDEVLEIATRSRAKAIHPGYGFLSENADFCESVQTQSDLEFVGPPPSAIRAMGSKSKSKAIMEKAGVTTAPGFYGDSEEEQEPLHLLERAKEVGFPLLIKAIMGGGGKGMRLVFDEKEFLESLESCKRESLNAFGDSRVLLERYLVNPRHVEVQIVADHHENCVSLHERDCSLQRRHQKIIEEAPASDLSEKLRAKLGTMGCKAAQAVGYTNAGTVEFLLEGDDFYFCEMNTRLQVEHPITELITGIDLVEWQLRVASGQELPLKQDEIPCCGHAFEARIYAEKPGTGKFLPSSGTIWHHDPPASSNAFGLDLAASNGIRVDTGIQSGQTVGVDYDPMICKLIVHDETREKARKKLVEALKNYQIAGVPTNIDFLIRCANHETFQKQGATHTGFLDDHLDEVLPPVDVVVPPRAKALAALATLLVVENKVDIDIANLQNARQHQASPWNSLSGSWRTFGNPSRRMQLADGTVIESKSLRDGSYEIKVKQNEDDEESKFHVNGSLTKDHKLLVVANRSEKMSLDVALKEENGEFTVCLWPQSITNDDDYFWEVKLPNPCVARASTAQESIASSGTLLSPMPGKISKIMCQAGDTIQKGDTLVVMEAMKMEHTVQATSNGIVESVDCKLGDVVAEQTKLVVIVAESQESDSDNDEAV